MWRGLLKPGEEKEKVGGWVSHVSPGIVLAASLSWPGDLSSFSAVHAAGTLHPAPGGAACP